MRAKKCDRCGVFYEKNEMTTKDKRMALSKVHTVTIDGMWDVDMDLCDNCFKALYEFLYQHKTKKITTGVKSWAEKEVEMACKRDGSDYCSLCYKSALKAYNSLMEDGHSNHSIGYTVQALNRLTKYLPLTPIEDTNDTWGDKPIDNTNGIFVSYQSKRMPSLFKDICKDGTIKYHNTDYCYCVNVDNPSAAFSNGFVSDIIHEMFPIKMPYFPVKPMKVVVEDFLYDEKNGDYDTMGILYLIDSDGQRIDINKYFAEDGNGDFVEISKSTYTYRKNRQIKKGQKTCSIL